jgi:hypothetical protein
MNVRVPTRVWVTPAVRPHTTTRARGVRGASPPPLDRFRNPSLDPERDGVAGNSVHGSVHGSAGGGPGCAGLASGLPVAASASPHPYSSGIISLFNPHAAYKRCMTRAQASAAHHLPPLLHTG